jgi:8-oxo-dGTP pyrophosphatase MutT (NUDIX family)
MGRRSTRHAFMPGKFVFPGGRTDPADSRIPVAGDLPLEDACRLGAARTPARARAIALSAVRETYEEAGLLIGADTGTRPSGEAWADFARRGIAPSLAPLRYVARAITPPGRVRRYDTHFFAAWRTAVAAELDRGPADELEELCWLTFAEARAVDLPAITRTVLAELEGRLATDPALRPGGPVPFYRMVRGKYLRDVL